jgi:hypothetical protein
MSRCNIQTWPRGSPEWRRSLQVNQFTQRDTGKIRHQEIANWILYPIGLSDDTFNPGFAGFWNFAANACKPIRRISGGKVSPQIR